MIEVFIEELKPIAPGFEVTYITAYYKKKPLYCLYVETDEFTLYRRHFPEDQLNRRTLNEAKDQIRKLVAIFNYLIENGFQIRGKRLELNYKGQTIVATFYPRHISLNDYEILTDAPVIYDNLLSVKIGLKFYKAKLDEIAELNARYRTDFKLTTGGDLYSETLKVKIIEYYTFYQINGPSFGLCIEKHRDRVLDSFIALLTSDKCGELLKSLMV